MYVSLRGMNLVLEGGIFLGFLVIGVLVGNFFQSLFGVLRHAFGFMRFWLADNHPRVVVLGHRRLPP